MPLGLTDLRPLRTPLDIAAAYCSTGQGRVHLSKHLSFSSQDLASGYMSGRLLQKLESVHFMLAHHTSDHFGFLEEHSRNRTTFYFTLARLLFMEDTPANFKSFVAPLQQVRCTSFSLSQKQGSF